MLRRASAPDRSTRSQRAFDIIGRASPSDEVIVAVLVNQSKAGLFQSDSASDAYRVTGSSTTYHRLV
jgi:phosphopantetheine adenylyltransferase